MATTKKTAGRRKATASASAPASPRRRTSAPAAGKPGLAASAQQIWLAGLGALGRAQSEGGKLFDSLVREGQGVQKSARKRVDERAEQLRSEVESQIGEARERTSQLWGWLENSIDERLQGALHKLKIPTRSEVDALARKVDRLSAVQPAAAARGSRAGKARASGARKHAGGPAEVSRGTPGSAEPAANARAAS